MEEAKQTLIKIRGTESEALHARAAAPRGRARPSAPYPPPPARPPPRWLCAPPPTTP